MTAERSATAVDRLAESYLDAQAALDPIDATFAGLPGHADRLTDYSPAGCAARADLAAATLREAAALTPADDVDAVTLATLAERLGYLVEVHEAGLDRGEINNIASPVQSVREVFDVAATATADDWADVAARLAGVPGALAGYLESLRSRVAEGARPPRRQVAAAAKQAAEFAEPGGYFTTLASDAAPSEGGELPDSLRADLAGLAARAAEAYGDLARTLTEEFAPGARDTDAVGRDAYSLFSRGFVGSTLDLEDTYRWGLEELARIETRMARTAARIVPGSTASGHGLVDEAVAALDADPARSIEGTDAFRGWMQELSDAAVDALAGSHFDIAEPLRRLICRIAPSTSGGVYYTGPSEDFSRPGQMWWSVPAGVTSFSTWRETTTVYHEGVPGHHLQVGQAVTQAGSLNRWRRMGVWVSGHGEGWALYAERLMEELGFLDDPGDLLGMLDAHALRASRVVVDIGVHLGLPAPAEVGGGTWDADKAWAFLSAHTRMPEPNRRFELERYLGWPGQAPSYKVGERVWLDLRERTRAAQGDAFDLRAFHARALDLGALPLDVLVSTLAPVGSAG